MSSREDGLNYSNFRKDLEKSLADLENKDLVGAKGEEKNREVNKGCDDLDKKTESKQFSSDAASKTELKTASANPITSKYGSSSFNSKEIKKPITTNWRDSNCQYERYQPNKKTGVNYVEKSRNVNLNIQGFNRRYHKNIYKFPDCENNLENVTLGWWRLIADIEKVEKNGKTEFENLWNSNYKIYLENKDLFTKPPKNGKLNDKIRFIDCYTSNYTDKATILLAALVIRKNLSFTYAIYYYCSNTQKMYMNLTDQELYETDSTNNLKIAYPTELLAPNHLKMKGVYPSIETTKEYLYNPKFFEEQSNEEKKKGGKWLIYAHGNLETMNHWWFALEKLVENKTLVAVKSSTAYDRKFNNRGGITMCYTSDFEDISTVKNAADKIRELTAYKYIMYYKTNESSAEGHYIDEGHFKVSLYMHTTSNIGEGVLYKRDEYNRWCPINAE